MLIHKKSLGVLQWVWDGVSFVTLKGVRQPKMTPATLEGLGLAADEWWVVPNGTPLARKAALHYPFFDTVTAGGELVDLIPWPAWKIYGEPEPEKTPDPGVVRARKYNRRKRS